jgi:2-succinyl-6-hydroxy-2,4-cyclohexadiene-1-carboxylate synthase
VVFLHGFSGSSNDWLPFFPSIAYPFVPYAIDLIGHGKSSSPSGINYYSAASIAEQIAAVLDYFHMGQIILSGYSMGGRAALTFANAYPDRIKGLILESASPGLIAAKEREERQAADNRLAEFILEKGIEPFIDYWEEIPLFHSQKALPKYELLEQRRKRLENNPLGLSNSLKAFGTGVMPDLWNSLNLFHFRTLLITGSLDEKFTAINKDMAGRIKNARHEIVQSAGHNVHLEKPKLFLNLLNDFLTQFSQLNED